MAEPQQRVQWWSLASDFSGSQPAQCTRKFSPRQLISGRVISPEERRFRMHSSVHYREPKGKGNTLFPPGRFSATQQEFHMLHWHSSPVKFHIGCSMLCQGSKPYSVVRMLLLFLRRNALLFTLCPVRAVLCLGLYVSPPRERVKSAGECHKVPYKM
jgi:hypothetical protein